MKRMDEIQYSDLQRENNKQGEQKKHVKGILNIKTSNNVAFYAQLRDNSSRGTSGWTLQMPEIEWLFPMFL